MIKKREGLVRRRVRVRDGKGVEEEEEPFPLRSPRKLKDAHDGKVRSGD